MRMFMAGSQRICQPLGKTLLQRNTIRVTRCICCHGNYFCFVGWRYKTLKEMALRSWQEFFFFYIRPLSFMSSSLQVKEKVNEDSFTVGNVTHLYILLFLRDIYLKRTEGGFGTKLSQPTFPVEMKMFASIFFFNSTGSAVWYLGNIWCGSYIDSWHTAFRTHQVQNWKTPRKVIRFFSQKRKTALCHDGTYWDTLKLFGLFQFLILVWVRQAISAFHASTKKQRVPSVDCCGQFKSAWMSLKLSKQQWVEHLWAYVFLQYAC